jgi:putative RNA 2'-phosphotransferase
MNNIEKTSKFLSYILRHRPDEIGIVLDPQGWTDIATLISCAHQHGKQLSDVTLREAVRTSDKQRFMISEDGYRIRANQGHSIDIDLGLTTTTPPDILYHGTASRFMASILASGLLPGSRHHVHLSAMPETAINVGQRHGKPVLLVVQAGDMLQAGHQFFVSANGVWLTDTVPPAFISQEE